MIPLLILMAMLLTEHSKCNVIKKEGQLKLLSTFQLRKLKENFLDAEEMHAFTFGKTTVHIGAEQAQNMQLEFEEECRMYRDQIMAIENVLKEKGIVA